MQALEPPYVDRLIPGLAPRNGLCGVSAAHDSILRRWSSICVHLFNLRIVRPVLVGLRRTFARANAALLRSKPANAKEIYLFLTHRPHGECSAWFGKGASRVNDLLTL